MTANVNKNLPYGRNRKIRHDYDNGYGEVAYGESYEESMKRFKDSATKEEPNSSRGKKQ